MDNGEENRALVAFTTLAPLSVGGLVGLLMVKGQQSGADLDQAGAALLVVGVLALAASFLHLGHPFRAYRAIAKITTSWLSREVALFGLFIVGLAAYSVWGALGFSVQSRAPLGWATAIVGLIALFSTGEVYRLQSRPAWNHWATTLSFAAGAVSAGVVLGIFVAGLNGPGATPDAAATAVALVCLALAAALTWLRTSSLRGEGDEARASWQLMTGVYRWTLFVRLGGAVLAAVLVLTGLWSLAWIPAVLGELSDRIMFFYTVVPVSMARRSGVTTFPTPPRRGEASRATRAGR
jgi:DMSO reductase anchor subunit